MQIDWPDVLAVAATLATLVASIYGARAAVLAAKQAGLQARFLIQEQDNRAWLQALLPRLQRSGIVVHGSDTAVALFWVQAGILEWVPTSTTGSPDAVVVRLRRA
ncbi:MAG: hypothetical protein AUI19_06190 [Myxococcales bacterium 13_1_40CM_2_68_15]|nr:MAG: hypothetical protein AUI19_06190 [Myxococcales bacterium 13_1_40CM_2_68_15]